MKMTRKKVAAMVVIGASLLIGRYHHPGDGIESVHGPVWRIGHVACSVNCFHGFAPESYRPGGRVPATWWASAEAYMLDARCRQVPMPGDCR